jgi:hypothetical protein
MPFNMALAMVVVAKVLFLSFLQITRVMLISLLFLMAK